MRNRFRPSVGFLFAVFALAGATSSAFACEGGGPCGRYGQPYGGYRGYGYDYGYQYYQDRGCGPQPCGIERERLRQRALEEVERYEPCDTWCWLERSRQGYCGSGCDFYRRHTEFRSDFVTVERPRALSLKDTPDFGCGVPTGCGGFYNGHGYESYKDYPPQGGYNHGWQPPYGGGQYQAWQQPYGGPPPVDPNLTPHRPFRGPIYPPR